jgi:uncharacterized membrane protein
MNFVDRLREAAKHANVKPIPAAIARDLGIPKGTVYRWFKEGIEPSSGNYLRISDKWGINGRWLKTGDGEMLSKAASDLPPDVREIVREALRATPQRRKVILDIVRAARKAVVTIAAVIPPLLAPQPSDAAGHNVSCALKLSQVPDLIHIVRKWLWLLARWTSNNLATAR